MSLEATIGFNKTVIIYLVSGIGGNLFSALLSDSIGVGASTAIFGILGAYLGFLILNWEYLNQWPEIRCNYLIFIMFILIINLFIGASSKNVDMYGHLGGFITGLALSFFVIPPL